MDTMTAVNLEHRIMEILGAEDGRTFEEKRNEALTFLAGKKDTILARKILDAAEADEAGRRIKTQFWSQGICACTAGGKDILLRKPEEKDRIPFLSLQKENVSGREFFGKHCYCELLWEDHIEDKALMCTIEHFGEYIGYCGINNAAIKRWEIGIEILKKWQKQGIGTGSVILLLDSVRNRLGVTNFRIRISPDNYASQALFEKLGAKPNGISEFWLHGAEKLARCEEENLWMIDERLTETARKFGVEPRKLLSHVLEYKIDWKERNS